MLIEPTYQHVLIYLYSLLACGKIEGQGIMCSALCVLKRNEPSVLQSQTKWLGALVNYEIFCT